MEWMLQVVDEIDDIVGALRLAFMGVAADIGLIVAGVMGFGAVVAALAAGLEVSLIATASIVLCLAAALKFREARFQPSG